MPIYNFSRRSGYKGAQPNSRKAKANLGSVTRLTDALNRSAWLLGDRVPESGYVSSEQVDKLAGIEISLKGLRTQMSEIFPKEQLDSEEEAKTNLDEREVQEARDLLSQQLDQKEKRIRGKQSRAAIREGKTFFVFHPKANSRKNAIGFEIDRTGIKGPKPLVSPKQIENFLRGD